MCGIAACVGSSCSALLVKHMLIQLQHRGQEGAGIAWLTHDGDIKVLKNFGYVHSALPDICEHTPVAIGHVRYSTTGTYLKNIEELHPFVVGNGDAKIAFAFNGTILNYKIVRKELQQYYDFVTDTDTEVFAKLIHLEYRRTGNLAEAVLKAMSKVLGSYSIVVLSRDRLVIARDPLGFKPLSYYVDEEIFLMASESSAITTLLEVSTQEVREVSPGEVIELKLNLEHNVYRCSSNHHRMAHCVFEYVYFARPDTVFNGVYVYDARKRMGMLLAEDEQKHVDVVVPVPETGRPAAYGFAQRLRLPVEDALIKLRYLGRSFIMPKELRTQIARFGIVESVIKKKRVALIDDSLVRGTTLRGLVSKLRSAGASEVHVRIASPPIRYPCFMGIDFPTRSELIAHNRTEEKVREILGADTLRYLSIDKLVEAVGLSEKDLCMACFTGKYPIPVSLDLQEELFKRY